MHAKAKGEWWRNPKWVSLSIAYRQELIQICFICYYEKTNLLVNKAESDIMLGLWNKEEMGVQPIWEEKKLESGATVA